MSITYTLSIEIQMEAESILKFLLEEMGFQYDQVKPYRPSGHYDELLAEIDSMSIGVVNIRPRDEELYSDIAEDFSFTPDKSIFLTPNRQADSPYEPEHMLQVTASLIKGFARDTVLDIEGEPLVLYKSGRLYIRKGEWSAEVIEQFFKIPYVILDNLRTWREIPDSTDS